jgi:POT family proton-dependent oligopeptide transporter
MSITFVEFSERFSWYGTTALFVNFIQQPRPFGSRTGAIVESDYCYNAPGWDYDSCTQPGGLGRGQQASTGLTTFNQFWAYLMPLFGGYIADTYLGRYMTIQCSIAFAILGHILLIISSLPTVMDSPDTALGVFALALVILGLGTGGFKSNISPLLAEQIAETRPHVVTDKKGERVIRDPAVTISRVFLYFYMMINIGSLIGGIGMVYAERYIGFWLAYALPTFVFFLAPVVLITTKKKLITRPPTGSVLGRAFKLLSMASKGKWSINPVRTYRNYNQGGFWDAVKPSTLGASAPEWMRDIDDAWVEQVARGFDACKVLFWMPLYWLSYNQITNNLTSQSAVMQLNGGLFLPNSSYYDTPITNNHLPQSLTISSTTSTPSLSSSSSLLWTTPSILSSANSTSTSPRSSGSRPVSSSPAPP